MPSGSVLKRFTPGAVPKKSPSGHQTAGVRLAVPGDPQGQLAQGGHLVGPVAKLDLGPQRGDRLRAVEPGHAGRLARRDGDRLRERLLAGPVAGRIGAQPAARKSLAAFSRSACWAASRGTEGRDPGSRRIGRVIEVVSSSPSPCRPRTLHDF